MLAIIITVQSCYLLPGWLPDATIFPALNFYIVIAHSGYPSPTWVIELSASWWLLHFTPFYVDLVTLKLANKNAFVSQTTLFLTLSKGTGPWVLALRSLCLLWVNSGLLGDFVWPSRHAVPPFLGPMSIVNPSIRLF